MPTETTQEYLARGGKINHVPKGEVKKEPQGKLRQGDALRRRLSNKSSIEPRPVSNGHPGLGGVAMHVAKVRRYTSSMQRFTLHLSAAFALHETQIGSPKSFALPELVKPTDFDAFMTTAIELSHFLLEPSDILVDGGDVQ